jgi:hypothetical protein
MDSYLIPANSKKSLLYFSIFNQFDLILFGIGVGVSLLLLMVLPVDQLLFAIIAIAPGLVAAFLVMPIPNYHNVLTFIRIAIQFYTTRQNFIWKGWCFGNGDESEK